MHQHSYLSSKSSVQSSYTFFSQRNELQNFHHGVHQQSYGVDEPEPPVDASQEILLPYGTEYHQA